MSDALLPEGWAAPTIGELFMVVGGGTPSTKEPQYWGEGYPWITSADIDSSGQIQIQRDVTKFGVENSTTNVVPPCTVLVVTRVGLGKVAIAAQEICFSQDVQGLLPLNGVDAEYCLHFLSHEMQRLKFDGRGTTISGITKKQLKDAVFPLPPLAEQKRIVAKIEELFAKLDKGIESLRDAQTQLKLYQYSLLKHAFEGKLTADWRAANADKLETPDQLLARIKSERAARHAEQIAEWKEAVIAWKEGGEEGKKPTKPRAETKFDKPTSEQKALMSDVPVSWQWLQIADFAFVTKLAGFEYTKFVNYVEAGDLPVIKAENAGPLGFRETDFSKVQSAAVSMLTRSHLKGGELLMVFVGAGTGNVAMVPEDRRFFLGPNIGMMRVESDCVLPRYVEVFLRSPIGRELTLATVKAVAQPSLSMGTIRQIPIALPSPEEQVELLRILEAKISGVEAIEAEVETQLEKSEALRQSILKQAFSGKLVPQDPNDEPASKLLERIRDERTAAKPPKRKAKARA